MSVFDFEEVQLSIPRLARIRGPQMQKVIGAQASMLTRPKLPPIKAVVARFGWWLLLFPLMQWNARWKGDGRPQAGWWERREDDDRAVGSEGC